MVKYFKYDDMVDWSRRVQSGFSLCYSSLEGRLHFLEDTILYWIVGWCNHSYIIGWPQIVKKLTARHQLLKRKKNKLIDHSCNTDINHNKWFSHIYFAYIYFFQINFLYITPLGPIRKSFQSYLGTIRNF